MSRSSKGFADFFPTAPSVVAQKRSKAAQTRKRPRSPCIDENSLAPSSTAVPTAPARLKDPAATINRMSHVPVQSQGNATTSEDLDTGAGDLLNGVGSASSTSTASSVFSTSYNSRNHASKNGLGCSTSLTPLTNVDSSPPNYGHVSPERKDNLKHSAPQSLRRPSQPGETDITGISKQSYGSFVGRRQARPGKGEVKGVKVVYDPQKGTKMGYEPFGEKVCQFVLSYHSLPRQTQSDM